MDKYIFDKAVELAKAELLYQSLSSISNKNFSAEPHTPNSTTKLVHNLYKELKNTNFDD